MKTLMTIAVSTFAILALATAGYSQAFLKADHKMNTNRVRSNERHARSQALRSMTEAVPPFPQRSGDSEGAT